jgi:tRNA (guanine-N7-)-methyltransferase
MTVERKRFHRFRDKPLEDYKQPDLNPYLRIHRDMGPPVIVAADAPGFRGGWAGAFDGRDAPLHVEIGPGNGFYLSGMAARHPEYNWLGIEIRFKRVVLCAKKINAAGVSNARITRYDAWQLEDLFAPGEIAGLHINFPDPWKKEKHEKHRLLGPELARWAAMALAPCAEIRVKSDHRPNLERMAAAVADLPFEEVAWSEDVGNAGAPWSDDLVTNYQSKFDKRDEPTYALLLRRQTSSESD